MNIISARPSIFSALPNFPIRLTEQVVRDVYGEEDCASTVDAMWEIVEGQNPGLSRCDVSTWGSLKASGKYGLSSRGPCFHPRLVTNRLNTDLHAVLGALVGSEVMVSQDR